ncbi:MAG: CapA family protein [Fimbriimonadaceae bacterium]|nr:CapA family protein [Fimbriimonadaceae bacterium]
MILFALLASATLAQPKVWTLGVGGDIMLNGISAKTNPFVEISPYTVGCDVFIGNLEIPLTDRTTPTSRKSAEDVKAKRQFILKADPGHATHLKATGFDLVTLGNNHSMDYGPTGLIQMLKGLDSNRIAYAGAGINRDLAWEPAAREDKTHPKLSLTSMLAFMGDGALNTCWPAGPKSAGLAALKLGGVVNDKTLPTIQVIVDRAKKSGGFAIIALHWGLEKQTTPTPYQVALGRAFIDAGADVVLGHHPHVLQGAELYKGKPIFYSLGNLISPRPGSTAIFQLRFQGNDIEQVSVLPCSISGGSVSPIRDAKAMQSELARFDKLCDAVRSRYPSKESKKPKLMLWEGASAQASK